MPRVLRPRNFSIRPKENTPIKAVSKHSRTRKTRKNLHSVKFNAELARKKAQKNSPARFNVVCYPNGNESGDVEMQDSSSTPQPTVVPVVLPRAFIQPPVSEPSSEAIAAASGSSFVGETAAFVRDCIEDLGPEQLKTASSISTKVDSSILPKEMTVTVNDPDATSYPTHMLAVYAPVAKKPENAPSSWTPPKTDVKLYPVHALFLAAHCAKLGPFPPSPTTEPFSSPRSAPQTFTLPVRPICLPAPSAFNILLRYFYLRSQDDLFQSFLPRVAAFEFTEKTTAEERAYALAKRIGETYSPRTLLQYAKTIQGVWQNACALGVFDDALWVAIDKCYDVILQALAIGTGNPKAVYVAKSPAPVKA